MSLHLLDAFVGFQRRGGERDFEGSVDGSVVLQAQLDAWNTNVLTCYTERERWDGHGQNLYADTYKRIVILVVDQPIGNLGVL